MRFYPFVFTGERRLKLTGESNRLDVNADFMTTGTLLNTPTLYPSAYLVLTSKGYTKHYYAGADRVAASLGGGGLKAVGSNPGMKERADWLFWESHDRVNGRTLQETGQALPAWEYYGFIKDIPGRMNASVEFYLNDFYDNLKMLAEEQHDEKDVYFYHSDHLGSASWITDGNGIPVQHLQYLPFGEPFVDQHPAGYQERFRFTGKERDEETGYGYFGARYMDHELTAMWLSVDPMADKYPSISPYAYCAWNPIKLVDQSGEFPILPLLRSAAVGVEFFSKKPIVREVAYSINHPVIAVRVGFAKDGGKNLSSVASNFAINMSRAGRLTTEGEGSQRNAIRHTLWQAILTDKFGKGHAKRIGNAHEDGIDIDLSQRRFNTRHLADKAVDLLNNEIGRTIGEQNPGIDNATMAEKVAAELCNNGLWTASENRDGTFSIQKTKISRKQYVQVIDKLKNLNNYGLPE